MVLNSIEFVLNLACSFISQRSALRRLLPRTMFGNRDCVSLNGDLDAKESHLNELDDTAGSSRSSFADIWDSTSIEVRMEDCCESEMSCFDMTKT